MFNLESYQFETNPGFFDYQFESVGSKGIIKKVARFSLIQKNLYNFGFGDLNEKTGEIIDTVESNNGDGDKVLATVADIIYYFTSTYHNVEIFIRGTNEVRTRRYQMGISKYWPHIELVFEIEGFMQGKWQPFQKGGNYEAFKGHRL